MIVSLSAAGSCIAKALIPAPVWPLVWALGMGAAVAGWRGARGLLGGSRAVTLAGTLAWQQLPCACRLGPSLLWSAVAPRRWSAPRGSGRASGNSWAVLTHLCFSPGCLLHNRAAVSNCETCSHRPPTLHRSVTLVGTPIGVELLYFIYFYLKRDTRILYVWE